MKYQFNDGGRSEAGYKGDVRDCVVRAIAIATNENYGYVYNLVGQASMHISAARTGVSKSVSKKLMLKLGWKWTPTMGIGTGCRVHLKDGELPMGRLIVSVSRHWTAVLDGVIHDTHDPSRNGSRCVYGYWSKSL